MTARDKVRRAVRRVRDRRWSGLYADHVGLLDATTLWVAVSAGVSSGDRLALLTSAGTVEIGDPATADGLAGRADLAPHVAAIEAGGADVVVLTGGRVRQLRPTVWTPPDERPVLAPVIPGTQRALRLVVRPAVRLGVADLARGVELLGIGLVDDRLTLHVDIPHESEVTARLVIDSAPATELATARGDDGCLIHLDEAAVAGLDVAHSLEVVVDGHQLPVVRRHRDLRDLCRGVPLPRVAGTDDRGDTVVRVEYSRTGTLTVRRLPADEELA